jgi:hypothetical protein
MKALKILVLLIVFFAVLILAGGFLLPKRTTIRRSIMIAAKDSIIYTYVTDFTKLNEWSPWLESEPSTKTIITGSLGKVGAIYSWEGNELGSGNFRITNLAPYSAVYQKITFYTPFKAEADNDLFFEQQGDSTKVTWIYDGENKGIIDKWRSLAFNKMMTKDWERGLQRLKANIEKNKS